MSQQPAPRALTRRQILLDRALKLAAAAVAASASYGLYCLDAHLIEFAASRDVAIFSTTTIEMFLATSGLLASGLGSLALAIHVLPPKRLVNVDSERAVSLALAYPALENYRLQVADQGRGFNTDDMAVFEQYHRAEHAAAALRANAAALERSRAAALSLASAKPLPDSPLGKASSSLETAASANVASRLEIGLISRGENPSADNAA
jgi:hypothetical protein